jgi:hypothetical protein
LLFLRMLEHWCWILSFYILSRRDTIIRGNPDKVKSNLPVNC